MQPKEQEETSTRITQSNMKQKRRILARDFVLLRESSHSKSSSASSGITSVIQKICRQLHCHHDGQETADAARDNGQGRAKEPRHNARLHLAKLWPAHKEDHVD